MRVKFCEFETYGTRPLFGVKTNVLCISTIQRVSARERNEKYPGLITPAHITLAVQEIHFPDCKFEYTSHISFCL